MNFKNVKRRIGESSTSKYSAADTKNCGSNIARRKHF